jgi:hypothetical protein
MRIFERSTNLEGLPNILMEIWDRYLNDQIAENEQK